MITESKKSRSRDINGKKKNIKKRDKYSEKRAEKRKIKSNTVF